MPPVSSRSLHGDVVMDSVRRRAEHVIQARPVEAGWFELASTMQLGARKRRQRKLDSKRRGAQPCPRAVDGHPRAECRTDARAVAVGEIVEQGGLLVEDPSLQG